MKTTTRWLQRVLMLFVVAGIAGSAYGQRTVTLRLNTATLPDTISTESVMRVMGAVDADGDGSFDAPFTLPDGNVISWSNAGDQISTITATNVGGDYWDVSFQVPNDATTQFKFYSHQAQDSGLDGWEADPNPQVGPGTADTTLALHYFEANAEWHGVTGDRGEWDWRPFEHKEDSVAVFFRVAMFGEEAEGDGYDAANAAQIVGLRGNPDIAGSPLSWDVSIPLDRESSDADLPGNRIHSAVAYFPVSSKGQTQAYKFVLESDGVVAWEEGNVSGDRTFVIPEQDTTLHWVWYGDTAPVLVPPETAEGLILFTVDLSPYEEMGLFNRARGDTLWVYGSFNGWQDCPTLNPDMCLMSAVPGDPQFELGMPLVEVPGRQMSFKYFLDFNDETFQQEFGATPPSGWEEGHATGINRTFLFEGSEVQALDLAYFNDVAPANVIPAGTSIDVHFSVDMTPAIANEAQPFVPGSDSLWLQLGDPIWGFTQGYYEVDGAWPETPSFLSDPDGDNIYTGTLTVNGPTYSALSFRYEYGGSGTSTVEEPEGGTTAPGRNRLHYIVPNNDGTWPSEYTLPDHVFSLTAPHLYEENPAFSTGVEQLPGEQPTKIALGANYPNPFNPTTSFEYSLTGTEHVKVRVFDAMGRQVATLVDGVQSASTYRVTFDASHLASGVYLYQLETPTQVMSRKMVLIK